jgi:hypothetical protein
LRCPLATRFIERARTLLLVNDVLVEDKAENESSLKYGFRLMRSYQITETKEALGYHRRESLGDEVASADRLLKSFSEV